MTLIRNLILAICIYVGLFFFSSSSISSVKNLDFYTVASWSAMLPLPENFNQKVDMAAAKANINTQRSLTKALGENELVKDILITEEDLNQSITIVKVQYSLPENIKTTLAFATNKKTFIPPKYTFESGWKNLFNRNPVLVDIQIMKDDEIQRLPDLGTQSNAINLPSKTQLQLDIIANIFNNDQTRVLKIPQMIVEINKRQKQSSSLEKTTEDIPSE